MPIVSSRNERLHVFVHICMYTHILGSYSLTSFFVWLFFFIFASSSSILCTFCIIFIFFFIIMRVLLNFNFAFIFLQSQNGFPYWVFTQHKKNSYVHTYNHILAQVIAQLTSAHNLISNIESKDCEKKS